MLSGMSKVNVINFVVLILVLGSLLLAVLDKEFRPIFGDIVTFGLGGFTGQLVPRVRS